MAISKTNIVATKTSIIFITNIETIRIQTLMISHNIEIILFSSNLKNLSYSFFSYKLKRDTK